MVGMDAAAIVASVVAGLPPATPPRPAVPPGPARTVGAAIRRAHLADAITWRRRVAWERDLAAARRAARRLPEVRAREIRGALGVADALARRGRLGAERLVPVMAGVRATTWTFRLRPFPAAGARLAVPGDALVFEYRPGFGVQAHPLATAGRLNALARACLHGGACRPLVLQRTARAVLEHGVRARGELRLEYQYPFGTGVPPWTSSMAQATTAQALARAGRVTRDGALLRGASEAYRALVSGGTAVRDGGRVAHFSMYSFQPSTRVLNGELQTLVGLADYARISGNREARRVGRRTARSLARELPGWDTGAWTLYQAGGREANLHYHRLAADFAAVACRRGLGRGFCPAARRYARYTREPPRLDLAAAASLRAGRSLRVVVRASKQASGTLVVRFHGRTIARRAIALGRVPSAVVLRPRRPGKLHVALDARAVNGRSAAATALVRVTPRPRPRPKRDRGGRGGRRGDRARA